MGFKRWWYNSPSVMEKVKNKGENKKKKKAVAVEEKAVKTKKQKQKGKFDYFLVETDEDVKQLCKNLEKAEAFSFDFETTTEDPLKNLEITEECKIVGTSFSWKPGFASYIPINHDNHDNNFEISILQRFKPYFEDTKKIKIAHNVKFEAHWLKKANINLKMPVFDPMLGANLLKLFYDNIGLKELIEQIFGYKMITYEEITGYVDEPTGEYFKSGKNKGQPKTKRRQRTFNEVEIDERCLEYTCGDSDWALRLYPIIKKQLEENGLYDLCVNLDIPLALTLVNMERVGWHVDTKYIKYLSSLAETKLIECELNIKKELSRQLRMEEEEIDKLIIPVGKDHKPLNLNSNQHISWILYDQLGMPVIKKTKKGSPSTDAEAIEKLSIKYPQIALFNRFLEYKKYETLKNTFVDGYGLCVRENNRIHSTIDQVFVRTSRFNSRNPNLQNIPTRKDPLGIKNMFVAPEGHLFVFLDYSQIELRIFAWYSDDPNMKDAFKKNQDIHSRTAWEMFELNKEWEDEEGNKQKPIKVEEVKNKAPGHRFMAKTVNFGIIYGMMEKSLANDLWKRTDDDAIRKAKGILNRYNKQYPGLSIYQRKQVGLAKKFGYVTTMFNRMRLIPDIESTDFYKKSFAERTAYNTPIQGSASEIIKSAMVRINKELPDVKMIMQIHDELVFEIPVEEVIEKTRKIKEIMETPIDGFDIPIIAEANIAQRAGEEKEFIISKRKAAVKVNKNDLESDNEHHKLFIEKLNQGGIKIVT